MLDERVPHAHRGRQNAGGNGTGVDPSGPVRGQPSGGAPEQAPHGDRRHGGEQTDTAHAVLPQHRGLLRADAVQGLHRQRPEPAALSGPTARTPPGASIRPEAVAATVIVEPMPTRMSTPSRDRVCTRSNSPRRRASAP
ncbi:hypothetical protein [Streptomyces sp. LRE541]|uniref:hypothetical protein n=1 Tax=Streptomyces sp. LRE541 TaxID=2931983 RepID=UPI0032C48675